MRTPRFFLLVTGLLVSGLLSLAATPPAYAQNQDQDLSGTPGYVDLSEISQWFDTQPNVEVNLRGSLLNLIAAGASDDEEPGFGNLIRQLKAIQVRGFPFTAENRDAVLDRFEQLTNRLQEQGWERIVYLREEGEWVNIFVQPQGDGIAGLTVMATNDEDNETIFVNIVGSIQPEQISEIGRGLDIEPLQNVDTSRSGNNP